LNVHGVDVVRQTEMRTSEPLIPEPSSVEVEIASEKLKIYKSPGIYQIPAQSIQTCQFCEEGRFATELELIYYCIYIQKG